MARLRSFILTAAAAVGAFCIVVFAVSVMFGVKPQVVVSGSMEPTLPTGSLLLVKESSAADIRVGDIVTVSQPGGQGLITHRVTSIEQQYSNWQITMRGDANAADDPQPYVVRTVGKVIVTVPWAGYLAGLFRTPFGIAGIIVFGLALLLTYFWQPGDKRSRKDSSVEGSGEPPEAHADGLPSDAAPEHAELFRAQPGQRE